MTELRIVASVVLIFSAIIGLLGFGFSWAALIFIGAIAALMSIPIYFEIHRSKPPTRAETFFATVWLWLRRTLGWLMGLIFLAASYSTAFHNGKPATALVFLMLAVAMIYFGWVGQGPKRGQLRDDIKLHKENKERYKWKI